MVSPNKSVKVSSVEPEALNLLIVARGQHELYRRLQRRLRDCTIVAMLFDRREGERRQAARPVPVDRRRGERRSALHPREDLKQRKYVFARPHTRRPRD
jgi:hypothetical protein